MAANYFLVLYRSLCKEVAISDACVIILNTSSATCHRFVQSVASESFSRKYSTLEVLISWCVAWRQARRQRRWSVSDLDSSQNKFKSRSIVDKYTIVSSNRIKQACQVCPTIAIFINLSIAGALGSRNGKPAKLYAHIQLVTFVSLTVSLTLHWPVV